MKSISTQIHKSIQQRQKLLSKTNALRIINGAGDGLPGLLIDAYHQHLHIQILDEAWQKDLAEIKDSLESCMPVEYMIAKFRRGLDIKSQVLKGKNSKTIVEEYGLKFEVDLNDGLNCGLFLDMRRNRHLVATMCKNKKVLNTFAYTCSFGVHARAEGAIELVNIDISRKILDRGRLNYTLNNLPVSNGEFIKADALEYMARAEKKENHFDVIILDPPSFARLDKKVFQVKKDLARLLDLAVTIINSDGVIFVSSNNSTLTYADLESLSTRSFKGRRIKKIERIGQDKDFLGSNSFKESYLVGLCLQL